MIAVTSLVLSTLVRPQDSAVTLERKFRTGESRKYQVRSHLMMETTETGQPVAIPEEVSFEYDFTTKVTAVQPSGFAQVEYTRPALVLVEGETFDQPSRRRNLTSNDRLSFTLSPINEVTDITDLAAKPKNKKGGGHAYYVMSRDAVPSAAESLPFATALYQMAVMVGSPASSLDFSPKLPFEPVIVGSVWRKTVSYSPQALKGNTTGQQAVQRVDMTYKYVGRQVVAGRPVIRIEGSIDLETDATRFVADSLLKSVAESPVKALKVSLHGKVIFDLDPVDLHTIRATGKTSGNYDLRIEDEGELVQVTQKITGTASLKQVTN